MFAATCSCGCSSATLVLYDWLVFYAIYLCLILICSLLRHALGLAPAARAAYLFRSPFHLLKLTCGAYIDISAEVNYDLTARAPVTRSI